jgi:hypothetical protein
MTPTDEELCAQFDAAIKVTGEPDRRVAERQRTRALYLASLTVMSPSSSAARRTPA